MPTINYSLAALLVALTILLFSPANVDANNSPSGTSTKIIPLPIYSTLPNEGSTYGFMPVFMIVDDNTQFTRAIIAPSVTWNSIIQFTHTFRIYKYPSPIESLTIIPSISSHLNRGLTLEYLRQPTEAGRILLDVGAHFRRSVFYRFFGIGPDTNSGSESSYTRVGGDAGGRVAYALTPHFNAGVRVQFQRDLVERINVDFLPLTNARHPGTPGLGGSTTIYEALSLRYDTRPNREYSRAGIMSELLVGAAQGMSGTDRFGKIQFEARGLWDQNSWSTGGARVFWGYTPGSNIPFYLQNSLGGSSRLRGFTEDRFIDQGAWTAEIEQRLTTFSTRIYGVVADWRIDPFVAIGQVYRDAAEMFRHPRISGGLGFRAFVQPNVLGRVDTAIGGEGIKVYVELGYPF